MCLGGHRELFFILVKIIGNDRSRVPIYIFGDVGIVVFRKGRVGWK